MDTARCCIFFGLLAFLSTQVLAQGIVGALSGNVIPPLTRKGKGCSSRSQCPPIGRAAVLSPPEIEQTRKVRPALDLSDLTEESGLLGPRLERDAGCPEGFLGFEDKCYVLVTSRSSWPMAKAYCRFSYDLGELASIKTFREYKFIRKHFAGDGNEIVWIGMFKKTPLDPFTWVSGESVPSRPFGPQAEASKGYVAMSLDKYQFLLIENSQRKLNLFHFLCSTPRSTEREGAAQTIPAHKERDKISQNNIVPGVPAAFKNGKSSITSASPENEDKTVARKSAGAAKDPTRSASAREEPVPDFAEVVPIKAAKQYSAEPDSQEQSPGAEQVAQGSVTPLSDAEQMVRSSKKSGQENSLDAKVGAAVEPKKGDQSSRYSGWKEFEGHYYKAFFTKSTFRKASWDCWVKGAQLASLHSERESAFLREEIMKERSQKRYWIGLVRYTDGVHWTDGSRMDFSDLGTHTDGLEVESAREAEDLDTLESPIGQCFAISSSGGEWAPMDCQRKLNYICRKAKDAGVPLQDTNGQIPSDVGHADKPPVFAGTQKSTSTKTETGHVVSIPSILVALVGVVVVVTITAVGVTSWYRQNTSSSVAWKWARLESERAASDQDSHTPGNASQYMTLEDGHSHTVEESQPNMYGTIAEGI